MLATDVTGLGLLGHLPRRAERPAFGALLEWSVVPVVDTAREALRDSFFAGGTRRNLEWGRPHLWPATDITERA